MASVALWWRAVGYIFPVLWMTSCFHAMNYFRNARIARNASIELALNYMQASRLRCLRCVRCVRLETGLNSRECETAMTQATQPRYNLRQAHCVRCMRCVRQAGICLLRWKPALTLTGFQRLPENFCLHTCRPAVSTVNQ